LSDKKYRIAVVGGAGMWGRHYLHACSEHPQCDTILVDTTVERRRAFAQHYGIETQYDTVEDLLKVEVPDIVCAILPVEYAPAAVIACAEAGVKAVSCEKPISIELSHADEMVRICRERGTAFGCATAYWEMPFLSETADWLRQGHIGALTAASIPGGLPREVAGAGCVQLTMMRTMTGMEVEWVEGWTLPSVEGYHAPEADDLQADCPAYGRMGLSGGIECQVPEPRAEQKVPSRVWVEAENGQAWLARPEPIFIQGTGPESTPVRPDFLDEPRPGRSMKPAIERLIEAVETHASEVVCSGHDYRQALEIAIAFKLSAAQDHKRIELPLEDRSQRIYPHPYRMRGGDVAGWGSIGYEGPPQIGQRVRRNK
jgi:predicted dehydrogenase